MKINITLKHPDALEIPIWGQVKAKLEGQDHDNIESAIKDATESVGNWFRYGEYLTVEFDTVAGTATVKPR